jgi:hypothetical protein
MSARMISPVEITMDARMIYRVEITMDARMIYRVEISLKPMIFRLSFQEMMSVWLINCVEIR